MTLGLATWGTLANGIPARIMRAEVWRAFAHWSFLSGKLELRYWKDGEASGKGP